MHIKQGDTVIVIAGKERGKTSKVLRALPKENRILVEGVNVKKKHQRSRRGGQKGQVIEKALPIHVSNVMLVDPKSGARTRVGKKTVNGKLVRFAKKSGVPL